MDVRSIVLTANKRTEIPTSGRFFMLVETAAPLDVEFLKARSAWRETGRNVEAGYKSFPDPSRPAEDQGFDGLVFTSSVNQTVRYATSVRAGDYSRIGIDVTITQPDTTSTVADITVSSTALEVLAANANRKHSTVRNIGDNNIRIGDEDNVAAARGYQLRPGEYYTHDGTDALFAIREGASDSTVCVIEHTTS